MKNTVGNLGLIVALGVLLLVSACGDSKNEGLEQLGLGVISFNVGGDSYVFGLAAGDAVSAGYTTAIEQTCVIGMKGLQEAIHIYFPGMTTDTFTDADPQVNDAPKIGILLNGGTEYYTWQDDGDSWFSITVTSYGSVGKRIEGTFAGKLVRDGGTETITVENGVFSVARYPDS